MSILINFDTYISFQTGVIILTAGQINILKRTFSDERTMKIFFEIERITQQGVQFSLATGLFNWINIATDLN